MVVVTIQNGENTDARRITHVQVVSDRSTIRDLIEILSHETNVNFGRLFHRTLASVNGRMLLTNLNSLVQLGWEYLFIPGHAALSC